MKTANLKKGDYLLEDVEHPDRIYKVIECGFDCLIWFAECMSEDSTFEKQSMPADLSAYRRADSDDPAIEAIKQKAIQKITDF